MKTIDLNGKWDLRQVGNAKIIPASVPGDVYADLLSAGEIRDPFYRDNENNLQWIGQSDWQYCRTFVLDQEFLRQERIQLCCDGLDTLATVKINNQKIAETDNMFRFWRWDVKHLLNEGHNLLTIDFASAVNYVDRMQREQPIPWWGSNMPKIYAGCHGQIRKEQCNFGWDWGIKAVTCGIWRPIKLRGFSTACIEDVRIRQNHQSDGSVILHIDLQIDNVASSSLIAEAQLIIQHKLIAEKEVSFENDSCSITLKVPEPRLWWPNNMGEQSLYDITIALKNSSDEICDSCSKRIGLRTLRLDRHKDQWGESFQFVVNGVPFFAKGANWIPADAILARMTKERYQQLVEDAAAANMNMLRVWGGGIYEDDAFYNACDEHGICVWQDFMFACTAYPVFNRDFMSTVDAEIRDNIRRLRHHACLALWCGNNELEQGLVGDKGWDGGQMPWDEYSKLFDKLLPAIVQKLDDEHDYWPGSPHTSRGDRQDYNNPNSGDAHLWSVWHGKEPFEWYRTCKHRFNSEFGFQSFPEPQTVHSYTEPEDRNITSWIMEHHQRSGIGNTTIMQYMLDWFRLPSGFENTLWISQILQGMAIKYACEHWRRSMPRGMGTLYWQLNDCWPVASWSSIDFFGRWKALHYMARRFFAPLLVTGLEDDAKGSVEFHVTNDLTYQVRAELSWVVTDCEGSELLKGKKKIVASPLKNSLHETLHLQDLLAKQGARDLLVWVELVPFEANAPRSRNLVLFARPKHLKLQNEPKVTAAVQQQDDKNFLVTLSSSKPAFWCWLELPGYEVRYSDNFVHLRPGEKITITISTEVPAGLQKIQNTLRIRSLVDSY